VCWGQCESGMTDIGVSCQKNGFINRSAHPKPMVCSTELEQDAGLCYDKCKDGYKGVGPVCWQRCPGSMKDAGVSCTKDSKGRGVGKPMTCGGDFPEQIGALCYANCPEDKTTEGLLCK
jgi:hypothetical protein